MNVFDFLTEIQKRKKTRSLLVRAGCGCNRLEKSSKKVYYNKYDVGSKIHFDPFEIQETWSKSGLLLKKELGRLPPQVTPQVAPVTEEKILEFCSVPRSRAELLEYLKLSDRKNLRTKYLNPLLASGKLKMTIPNKPNSRLQKYVRA